jgi:glucan-binding YG repeat protein
MRRRYRFSHRGLNGRYYWYSRVPGDSRTEQVSCNAKWFWGFDD